MAATVVIIGGGYGGTALAKALDEALDVVLLDPKDAFVHAVATLRGLVSEPWAERIFFSYDNLLTRGRVVRDRAVQVTSAGVMTGRGTRIDADYTVLATGSSYPFPAKMDVDGTAEAPIKQAATRRGLASAQRVLLVGAGPVGLELAGEITEQWPDKDVTIVDVADDILGGQYEADLREALRAQLADRRVRLVLSSPLTEEFAVEPGVAASFIVTTTAGESIEADIWFRCYGVDPSSDYLTGDLAPARRADGFVDVDDRLRVAGRDNVFAVGDVTAIPEPKRAAAATRHAGVVAANILSLASGGAAQTIYQPGPAAVLIPLGSAGGASQVPGPEGPMVWGAEITAQQKGADLMVGRYAEMFAIARTDLRREEGVRR